MRSIKIPVALALKAVIALLLWPMRSLYAGQPARRLKAIHPSTAYFSLSRSFVH